MSVRKHTAYNLSSAALPLIVSLFTIPVYIRMIGDARYGVLAIVWSLLGYFSFFDLGLSRATAQRIAALGNASTERTAATFWTALAMNGALGLLGGLIIWPAANYLFAHVINVEPTLKSELISALPWLALAVPLMTVSGVLRGSLQGRSQFMEMSLVSASSAVLLQITPLMTAWAYGPDLGYLIPSVVVINFLSFGAMFWRCKIHVFQGHLPTILLDQARSLLAFGGWVTVTSLVGPLMVVLDRFVIGAMMGASAVTYYVVPFQLAQRTAILPGSLTSALFPRFAAANGEEREQLSGLAIQSLAVVMTPLFLVALLVVEPFFRIWIGTDFASKASVTAQILLLGFWINGIAFVPFTELQAAGKPGAVAKCHLAEVIPYFIALSLGLFFFGVPGAALAFGLRTLADCMLLLLLAEGLCLSSTVKTLRFPIVLLLAGFGVAAGMSLENATRWLASGCIVLVSVGWASRSAPSQLRNAAIGFFGNRAISLRGATR